MSYLVPSWELTLEQKRDYCKNTMERALNRAMMLGLANRKEELTIRKLMPADLGLDNWTINQGSLQVKGLNSTGNNQVIAIYKLAALSPDPVAQRIEMGFRSHKVFIADLSEMYSGLNLVKAMYYNDLLAIKTTERLLGETTADLEKLMENKDIRCEAYMSEPWIIDPQSRIEINVHPICSDTLVIVGFVIELKGMTTA